MAVAVSAELTVLSIPAASHPAGAQQRATTLEAPPLKMPGCPCCHSDLTTEVTSSERPLAHHLSHSPSAHPILLFQALFPSDTCLFIFNPTSHARI